MVDTKLAPPAASDADDRGGVPGEGCGGRLETPADLQQLVALGVARPRVRQAFENCRELVHGTAPAPIRCPTLRPTTA